MKKEYLDENETVLLYCRARVNADGKLDFIEFDTEITEMYNAGRAVKLDKDGKAYIEWEED